MAFHSAHTKQALRGNVVADSFAATQSPMFNPLSPELILNGKKFFFDFISFKTLLSYNIEPKFKKKIFFLCFFLRGRICPFRPTS